MNEPDFEAMARDICLSHGNFTSIITDVSKALRQAYQAGMLDGMEGSVNDIEIDDTKYPSLIEAMAVSKAAYRAVMRIRSRAASLGGST